MARPRAKIDREAVMELYSEGLGYQSIANILGYTEWSVRCCVQESGEKQERRIPKDAVENVRHLYRDLNYTCVQCADELGLTVTQVRNIISNHNMYRKSVRREGSNVGRKACEVHIKSIEDPIFYVRHEPTNEKVAYHKKQYRDVSAMILGG